MWHPPPPHIYIYIILHHDLPGQINDRKKGRRDVISFIIDLHPRNIKASCCLLFLLSHLTLMTSGDINFDHT